MVRGGKLLRNALMDKTINRDDEMLYRTLDLSPEYGDCRRGIHAHIFDIDIK